MMAASHHSSVKYRKQDKLLPAAGSAGHQAKATTATTHFGNFVKGSLKVNATTTATSAA